MTVLEELRDENTGKEKLPLYLNALIIGSAIFFFLLAIQLMAGSFSQLGMGMATYMVDATSNPFVGLFIGLLATAILQSSSTTTSIAVAAVASGSLTLHNTIPIILGANIGTTITSTIVSMSYITRTGEFRKAISAGTVHDIFNILIVLLLFPLEIHYDILTNMSQWLTEWIRFDTQGDPVSNHLFLYKIFAGIQKLLLGWFGPYLVLILSILLLFGTVKLLSNILYNQLIGKSRSKFETVIFSNTFKSFGWGFLLTSAIQSSSLTTSLIIPLVATGKVHLKRAFQFILGANLGTTITAILAALFKSDAAVSLALTHFLFNLIGVLLFLTVPFLRDIPPYLAGRLGLFTMKYKLASFGYILITFFILPFTLIYFSNKPESIVKSQAGDRNPATKMIKK